MPNAMSKASSKPRDRRGFFHCGSCISYIAGWLADRRSLSIYARLCGGPVRLPATADHKIAREIDEASGLKRGKLSVSKIILSQEYGVGRPYFPPFRRPTKTRAPPWRAAGRRSKFQRELRRGLPDGVVGLGQFFELAPVERPSFRFREICRDNVIPVGCVLAG